MSAQGNEAQLLRRKTSDTEATLPDGDVDLLFEQAETDFAGYSRKVILQAVVVARTEELWMASSKRVTYQQNETRENLSDIAKALEAKLDYERKKLSSFIEEARTTVAVAFAVPKKVPTRRKDFPNG